jgi:hypothetical protein
MLVDVTILWHKKRWAPQVSMNVTSQQQLFDVVCREKKKNPLQYYAIKKFKKSLFE